MKMRLLGFLSCFFLYAAFLSADGLYEEFEQMLPEFTKYRRHLHQHPELKYEEYTTAAYIAQKLEEYGYVVTKGIAGTGLSTLLDSGRPGKTIGLRAEMDALPIKEMHQISYASCNERKMHACGHDGHMATLLMIAKYLKENTHMFVGKIKFIFQPAEEGGAGAAKMIEEGILENPMVDAIFGYHNYPAAFKSVCVREGCLMAGNDRFEIFIEGKDGHAAMPQNTLNPILVANNLLQSFQTLLAHKDPTLLVVLNFTAFNAGNTYNVVPKKAHIKGTLRTTSVAMRDYILEKMQEMCEGTQKVYGAKIGLKILEGTYPPTINTKREVAMVKKSAIQILGQEKFVVLEQPIMPAEDFAFYLQRVPGCFFFVGSGENSAGIHTDNYDFNDAIMPTAASVLTKTALNYLNEAH